MESVSRQRLVDLPHAQRVRVVRDEVSRITDRLSKLDQALLGRPAMGDWTVRDVIAHLVVVAEFYADSVARGADGDANTAGDRPRPGTGRGAIAAAAIRERAIEVAHTLNATVVDQLRTSAIVLAETLDDDESSLRYECYHPGGVLPANRFVVLFLKELGLHEWDIFEALEPPCKVGRWGVDAALQAMEEDLASGSLRWVTDASFEADRSTLRVNLSGEVVIDRDLLLEPEQARLVPTDEQRSVDSLLRVDASEFVLACSGRRDVESVVAQGASEGDPQALQRLKSRLTGM